MDIHMVQVDIATKEEEVISKAPQKNLRGFTFFNSGGELKLRMHVKYLDFLLYQSLLSDHLRKDRPKFHKALARRVRVHGMLQLLGMLHR
jgi:hypothetical protein